MMNNSDLADHLAGATGATKADARKAVDLVFAEFKVKDVLAREGRHPATGETIKIAASKKLSFSVAKAVKDRLNS